jgi:hypothetical protein
VAEKVLQPERLLGLLLQKARDDWEPEMSAVREACRDSEERHAQQEADLFRQAQVGTPGVFAHVTTCARAGARPPLRRLGGTAQQQARSRALALTSTV